MLVVVEVEDEASEVADDETEVITELELDSELGASGATSVGVGAMLDGLSSNVEASDWLTLVADVGSVESAAEDVSRSSSSLIAIAALVVVSAIQAGEFEAGSGRGANLEFDAEAACDDVAGDAAEADMAVVRSAGVDSGWDIAPDVDEGPSGIDGNAGISDDRVEVEFRKWASELNECLFPKSFLDMAEPVLGTDKALLGSLFLSRMAGRS